MSDTLSQINKVSQSTRSAIQRKSAQSLPNNPSERGYSAEEIKRRFYQPILDAANSALAEIDRVVDEANAIVGQLGKNLSDFIDEAQIVEPYKLDLGARWELNGNTKVYEVSISSAEHKIDDYKAIGVDMYLLDSDNNYTNVNQFEISPDGTVTCFNDTKGAGYVTIYIKRQGLVRSGNSVLAENVEGLGKVAKTNNYEDLDNKPDHTLPGRNEEMLTLILNGSKKVGIAEKANSATFATRATIADTAGKATTADSATTAGRATNDGNGKNISDTYAEKNGTYTGMTVGKSTNADRSIGDEDGLNIKGTYAKQDGNYTNMTVGNANNAGKANIATYADVDTTKGTISERLLTLESKLSSLEDSLVDKDTSTGKDEQEPGGELDDPNLDLGD